MAMIVLKMVELFSSFPREDLQTNVQRESADGQEQWGFMPQPPTAAAVAVGYRAPIIYWSRTKKTIEGYFFDGGAPVWEARDREEVKIMKLYFPADPSTLPLIALGTGTKKDMENALLRFPEALGGSTSGTASFKIANYDLVRLAESYPTERWSWDFAMHSDPIKKGKFYGTSIETSSLFGFVKDGSSPNEVGLMLTADNCTLKVRILRLGRVQFLQFTEGHLVTGVHPEFGDPWPKIVQILQTLQLHRQ